MAKRRAALRTLINIFRSAVLACTACSLLPQTAGAWGRVGHEAVALIAQHILKKADRPLYDSILNIIGRDEDGNFIGMGNIAACADGMKGKSFIGSGIAPGPKTTAWCAKSFPVPILPESGVWHYIDIPVSADPTPETVDDYCVDDKGHKGQCVTAQIRRSMDDLSGALKGKNSLNREDRQRARLALLMFIHLYGDLHQPMHCIDDGDRGGNSKRAHLDGSRINLHAIWDNLIEPRTKEKAADYEKRERSGARVDPSADYVKLLETDMKKKDTAAWLQGGDLIDQAALESFYIAKRQIYPLYREYQNSLGPDGGEPYLDYNGNPYYDQMKPITEDQIEKAGVRLAYLLMQIMDPKAAAAIKPAEVPESKNKVSGQVKNPGSTGAATTQSPAPRGAAPDSSNGAADGSTDAGFAKTLEAGKERILTQSPAAAGVQANGSQWRPYTKLSAYKSSIEFGAVLKALDLTAAQIEDMIASGINVQNFVDQAIYRKAWPVVVDKATRAGRTAGHWAVVFDVDETLLDNSPYLKQNAAFAGRLTGGDWEAWIHRKKAVAIPGARRFMTSLHQLVRESRGHGHIVIITDRHINEEQDTIANLREQGLYARGDIVLLKADAGDTKFIRRACIQNGNRGDDSRCSAYPPMKIIGLFGANLKDFVQPCTLNEAELFRDTLQWGDLDWPLWNSEYGQWQNNYACAN